MIILDKSILRSFNPDSSSADLLLAIRATGAQRVGVPWMVMEELAAQQAIKYQQQYEATVQAVEGLRRLTPWELEVHLGLCELDSVREHWREKWGAVVETIPTSDEALRKAAFREANSLPPCKTSKNEKTGSRDAAIWLSAVEYAQQNPTETVYFASANTRDFGDGTEYPFPMRDDLKGIEHRFFHWTNLDEAVAEFAKPATTDEGLVAEILNAPAALKQVGPALQAGGHLPMYGFECTTEPHPGECWVINGHGWVTSEATVGAIEAPQMYRIGDHEWCTAIVRWYLTGTVISVPEGTFQAAGCMVTASMLFIPDRDDPRLTVLRAELPQHVPANVLGTLDLPVVVDWTPAETAAAKLAPYTQYPDLHPYRGRRTYEGAAVRLGMRQASEVSKSHRDAPGG
ncbi:PIN domain-containing protein [Streptomyces sp. NPDC057611]|uniref:PIN domain-containing protein n=1 Tax=Streptomyces sp. NPDC057611 TaxID=3346182 RepID=UPI003691322C